VVHTPVKSGVFATGSAGIAAALKKSVASTTAPPTKLFEYRIQYPRLLGPF
jgi:hypothetical protein